VLLPVAISFFATLAAAVMAYGIHPAWVQHPWGLDLILISRRLQWPMVALSLILCLALLGLVISGKRRAWWLIALLPVLTLFGHRFLTDPINRYAIADEPTFVPAAEATWLRDEDHVVALTFNDQPYAYPYACLYQSPVVVQSDRQQRLLLMWNPRANAATAVEVARELKARELDIVSEPADGLLLYNGRTGQFIAGVTGNTPRGEKPAGVEKRLSVAKLTWKQCKAQQPQTRVMLPVTGRYDGPVKPLPPRLADAPSVALIGDLKPIAILSQDITPAPLNLSAGNLPVLLFRDPAGHVVAFDRHVDADLTPRFQSNHDRKRKTAAFVDLDTNSGWSPAGVVVDGDKTMKGKRLSRVPVQEDVYYRPAQFWYRDLPLFVPPGRETAGAGG
jgi:hypothetical protein